MAVVKGLTIDVGVNVAEFNKGLRSMDRDIKQTQRNVKALASSLAMKWDNDTFQKAQAEAQKALTQTEDKVKLLRDRLKHLEEAGSIDTKHYTDLQNKLIKAEADALALNKQLKELKDLKIDHVVKQFENAGKSISAVGKAMAPLSAAAAAILTTFSAIGVNTVKTAAEIKKLSQQLRMTTEDFQKWEYITKQTDVETTELRRSLIGLQKGLIGLQTGEIDKISQAMLNLGFTAESATHGVADNFELILKKLSQVEDPIVRDTYLIDIFGEIMAGQLLPLLNSGADGINQLTEEFYALGFMTDEQVNKLEKLNNTFTRIKSTFGSLKNEVGTALIPLIEKFTEFIETRIIPAVRTATEWFTSLDDRTKEMATTILLITTALAPTLLILGKMTSGVGGLIKTLHSLGGVFTFLSTHPIIAVIGVIAGLIIYLMQTNEDFKNSIMGLVSILGEALMPILDTVMILFNVLMDTLMPLIDMLAEALMPLLLYQIEIWQMLMEVITPLITMLMDILVPVFQIVMDVLKQIISLILDKLAPVFEFLTKLGESVAKTIKNIFNDILKVIEKVVNGALDFVNNIIKGINKLGKIIGMTIPELDRVEMKIKQETSSTVAYDKPKAPDMKKETKIDTKALGTVQLEGMDELVNASKRESQYVKDALTGWSPADIKQTEINNDYSNKEIKIEVVVQNYAETVDVDDMVRQINMKLAEQM